MPAGRLFFIYKNCIFAKIGKLYFGEMLRDNTYDLEYCTLDCDVDSAFYIPSYKESFKLSRGAGYFSLKSLILDMDGIIPFIENGGTIRLVCNPELSQDDIALIHAGTSLSPEAITKDLIQEIAKDHSFSEAELDALDVICNMIAEKRMAIKVAFMPMGIYHEKNGIFEDKEGNKVCFSGSLNETVSAKIYNYEQIDVYTSWTDGESRTRIAAREANFEKLWRNERGERIKVIDFPAAVEAKLFESYRQSEKLASAIKKYKESKTPKIVGKKNLYPYQKQAIEEFVANGFHHFYEMATGTGKTFTSIRTISRVLQEKGEAFVMICVPQIDLQRQWVEALNEDGYSNIFYVGGEAEQHCAQGYTDAIIRYKNKKQTVICVAVYKTFFNEEYKVYSRLKKINNLFIIVDEAHNLNATQVDKLPDNADFRLGLSATAERFQQSETCLFLNYFTNGEIKPFYYGIEDAIENNFLSHYKYTPIFVYASDDKFDSYKAKSKEIAALMNQTDRDEKRLSRLRRERSLLIKQEPRKLTKLRVLTKSPDYDFKNSVVYCGVGKDKDGENVIIDEASKILNAAGYKVHHYTSRTENRNKVKELFTTDYFDTLVAIKCLDEGVDIPKLDKIYIMASETSMRQTVQRRGRVLRLSKNTGKDIAYIYDMVVLPPKDIIKGGGVQALITSEFSRVKEYNRLADNRDENQKIIDSIFETYNITEETFKNEQESI